MNKKLELNNLTCILVINFWMSYCGIFLNFLFENHLNFNVFVVIALRGNPQRIDNVSSNKRIIFTYEQVEEHGKVLNLKSVY